MAKSAVKHGIRLANPYDLFALENLLAKAIDESGGLYPDYDQAHFFHSSLMLIDKKFVFVGCSVNEAEKKERILGCLALEPKKWSHNPHAPILESVYFYVLPEGRAVTLDDGKTPLWRGLIDAAKHMATLASYSKDHEGQVHFMPIPLRVELMFMLGTDNRAGAKDELLKGAGFHYTGGNHIFVPDPKAAEKAA